MSSSTSASASLSNPTLYLFSAACGICVANIYYNQPLLDLLAKHFNTTLAGAGIVGTAAQVGYGLGLFLFVPLGDLLDRRKLILSLTAATTLFCLFAALAPTLILLALAQLLIGLTTTSAQILIPFSIELTPPERRGQTVGILMAGLLTGILGARTVAGLIASAASWQAVFFTGAALTALLFPALYKTLPHREPTLRMSYPKLMHSLISLTRTPGLASPTLVSALSFGTFIAFWTALSSYMHDQFHRGAAEAGLFGLLGLVGAAGAPLAGKITDRRGAAFTITCCLFISLAAYLLMGIWPSLIALCIGVLLMDFGVQANQVAAQSKVIALIPEARSRLNTLYMCARFTSGAIASAGAAYAYTHFHWRGVTALCTAMTLLALTLHFTLKQDTTHPAHPTEEDLLESA